MTTIQTSPAVFEQQPSGQSIGDLIRLADMVAPTNFVPRNLRGRVPEVVATLLYGVEIGLPPMQSLQLIDMIEGKPCLNAQGQRAAILRAGHEFWIDSADATKAVVCGRRKGTDRVVTAMFTFADARQQNLTNKPNWKKMPREMLVARASTTLARQAFADVLMGVAYDPEELEPVAPTPVPAEVRRPVEPVTVAAGPDTYVPPPPVQQAPALMSADNLKAFLARAAEQGIDGDAVAAVVLDATGGRTDQPSELLVTEVAALRDALARAVAVRDQDRAAETADPEPDAEPTTEPAETSPAKPVGKLRGVQIHKQIAAMGYSKEQHTELILWASNDRTEHASELTAAEVRDLQDELAGRQQTPDGAA